MAENEQAQEEVLEQEEIITPEEEVAEEESTETEDDTIVLKKSDYTKLNRKAKAYDATKGKTQPKQDKEENKESYIDTVFMVKDLSQDEYDSLRDEANDLGIPFEKYVSSNSGKTVLDKLRSEKKSKDASEALTSKSPVFQKYTQADLKNMSAKELEKILPKE